MGEARAADSQFCPDLPEFQVRWDATSLDALQRCPKFYFLSQVQGWKPRDESAHLIFGGAASLGYEVFFRSIIEQGMDHDAALRTAIRAALEDTWKDGKPQLGSYEDLWHCTGVTPFKSPKGFKAKCPYSHKGKQFPAPGPAVCGCGSPTVTKKVFLPWLTGKGRYELVRLLVWYGEEVKNGALEPVSLTFPDPSNPADPGAESHVALCEVPWTLDFGVVGGFKVALCGWFDTIKRFGQERLISDYKTTKKTLGKQYFNQYSPNTQVDLYDVAGEVILKPRVGYDGVVIEAAQTLKEGTRFGFRVYKRTPEYRQAFLMQVRYYIAQAYVYAKNKWWPENRAACGYCVFNGVCSAPPQAQPHLLREHFDRFRWNPILRKREPLNDHGQVIDGNSSQSLGVPDAAGAGLNHPRRRAQPAPGGGAGPATQPD